MILETWLKDGVNRCSSIAFRKIRRKGSRIIQPSCNNPRVHEWLKNQSNQKFEAWNRIVDPMFTQLPETVACVSPCFVLAAAAPRITTQRDFSSSSLFRLQCTWLVVEFGRLGMGHRSCLDVAINAELPAHRSSLYVIYPICMKMVAVNLIYIYISSMVYQYIN